MHVCRCSGCLLVCKLHINRRRFLSRFHFLKRTKQRGSPNYSLFLISGLGSWKDKYQAFYCSFWSFCAWLYWTESKTDLFACLIWQKILGLRLHCKENNSWDLCKLENFPFTGQRLSANSVTSASKFPWKLHSICFCIIISFKSKRALIRQCIGEGGHLPMQNYRLSARLLWGCREAQILFFFPPHNSSLLLGLFFPLQGKWALLHFLMFNS